MFPSWSADFIDKLLTDSPWATQSTVHVELDSIQRMVRTASDFQQIELPPGIGLPRSGGSGIPGVGWPRRGPNTTGSRIPPSTVPGGGGGGASGGGKAEIFLTTRWASALPIRRARLLQQFGRERIESEEALRLLSTPPSEYVIEIAGFPTTVIRQGGTRFAKELKNTARLTAPGHRPVSAVTSDVPEHGMHLMATLTFPRFENLGAKDAHVELSATARGIKLRERFKLKDMIYNGNLEL